LGLRFSENTKGKRDLDCNYYVLRDNLAKAKEQFKDVPRMLKALSTGLDLIRFMKIVSTRSSLFRHGTSKFSYLWNGFKTDIEEGI
jgi:hypothetical protein